MCFSFFNEMFKTVLCLSLQVHQSLSVKDNKSVGQFVPAGDRRDKLRLFFIFITSEPQKAVKWRGREKDSSETLRLLRRFVSLRAQREKRSLNASHATTPPSNGAERNNRQQNRQQTGISSKQLPSNRPEEKKRPVKM